jgi:hypothetical protein
MQVALAAQSAFALHVALHVEAPQRKGKHEVAAGVVHVPAPSQLDGPVNVDVPAEHVAFLHLVPAP